jgi:xylulokinase
VHVLAIDLGTGGPKVALVDLDGRVVGAEFEAVSLQRLPGGGAEQLPAEWWSAIGAASSRLAARGLAEPDAVAVTGQWAGTVAVGEDGEPLHPALTWLDARGAPHARKLAGGPAAGYAPLKVVRWLRQTGGAPSLSGRDPLGHILWLRAERPDLYARTKTFLEPIDWLGFKLTGRAAATSASITLHWVADTRDATRVRYDDGLLKLAGLERAKLPELLPASAVLGELGSPAAADLGVEAGIPVVAGSPDTMSAAVGSGAVDDDAAHLYVGTSSWISCHVPYKRTDALHSIASLPAALPGRYIVSCEQQTAGAAIEAARDALFPGSGDDGYARLEELAERAPSGSGGVIFTPWLNGERTPVDDHLIRGGLFNLSLGTTREQVARAVFEGVSLNARWMHHYVERFAKRRLEPIAFIGGGARSSLWGQVMADVLGREIHRIADPVHANVRGAALLAGLALGELNAGDLHGRAAVAAVHEPDPTVAARYADLYAAFTGIYKANRKLYARLNRGGAGALGSTSA